MMIQKKLYTVCAGFDGNTCKTHSRMAVTKDGTLLLTSALLHISGNDWFEPPTLRKSRTGPMGLDQAADEPQPALCRIAPETFVNPVPKLHQATGKVLITGNNLQYIPADRQPDPANPLYVFDEHSPRYTCYAVYDDESGAYGEVRPLLLRETGKPVEGYNSGCCDRVDGEDGRIYLPAYCPGNGVTVMECTFDGETLTAERIMPKIDREDEVRGLCEPSLTQMGDLWLLGLRGDSRAYYALSNSPLGFREALPLVWETGYTVPTFNTQVKWLRLGGRLYLVYTRRTGTNEHVFRCRAPLFMAEFDVNRLCLLRDTEIPLTPERGARCGNFGVTEASDDHAYVVTTEWMQPKGCEKYGSDNAVFIAELTV